MKWLLIGWAVITVISLITMFAAVKNAPLIEDDHKDDNDYDMEMSSEDWDHYSKMIK